MAIVGAVDIGGTKIAVGAISSDGQIILANEIPTLPEQGFADAMDRIKRVLSDLALAANLTYQGIGVACPGPLDPLTGILDEVGTLPEWQGGNLTEALGPEFSTSVAVENDADAAALAESHWGAGKGNRDLIYITVSTGIGGGIVLGGQLYRGARGVHPELGHQIIDPTGPLCYCRAHGCWESLASGSAIAAWVQEQDPSAAPRTAGQIAALADQGDPLALKAMEREGYYLGLGLSNIITLFAPEKVVLGGGVMKSSHLFMPRALHVLKEVCTQVPIENTSIESAALGSTTGLMGAAQAWFARHAHP